MPMSSNALTGHFHPTPFQTHTTKLGKPLETVRAINSPGQLRTDLSTLNDIPSNQTNKLAALFSSKVFRFGLTGLLIIIIGAAVGISLGIILSHTPSSTTNITMTTTMTTTARMTTTTANASSINSTNFASLASLTSLTTSTTVTATTTTSSAVTTTMTTSSTSSTATTTMTTSSTATTTMTTSSTVTTTMTTSSTATTTTTTTTSSTATITTTTSSTATTTTTTVTTTTADFRSLSCLHCDCAGTTIACSSNETVYGVWNTTAGGNCLLSTSGSSVGNYYPSEIPQYACNNIMTDRYTSYGACYVGATATAACGLNTGFYRTPARGASLIIGLQVCTSSNLPARDPLTVTLEGSNQPVSSLNLGSSWTLIYSGSSGLATDPGRSAYGIPQLFTGNSIWYSSYRFLVTSKRGLDSCTTYAEVQLIGY